MKDEEIQSGEELLKTKQEERKIRKGKKKKNLIKQFLKFCTAVFIIITIAYCSRMRGWYLPQKSFEDFKLNRVQIVNNKIVKNSTIEQVMTDIPVPRIPLYLSKLTKLKQEILLLPPVDNIYIRRYAFPARIQIIIREKEPLISISPNLETAPVAVYTKDGSLIKGADYLPLPKEYDTILVLSYGNNGDDYNNWDQNRINEIEKLKIYIETFSNEKVEYIDLRQPQDIYVKIKSVTMRFNKNDDKIYDKIKLIPSVLPKIREFKDGIKYVDLRWDNVFLKLK